MQDNSDAANPPKTAAAMTFWETALRYLGGVLVFGYLLMASCAASYWLACRVCRAWPVSLRLAGAVILQYYLLTAAFFLLIGIRLFNLPAGLILISAAFVVAWRCWAASNLFRADLVALKLALESGLKSPLKFAMLAGAVVFLTRTLRGFVMPPLGWDALTYHFIKAGRWVQFGAMYTEKAPDAWAYYEYFPAGGDIFWAWCMLPFHGDSFTGPAGSLQWLTVLVAAYALGRQCLLPPLYALWASILIGFSPSSMNFITAGYIENVGLACFLSATAFTVYGIRTRGVQQSAAVMTFIACGLMCGLKISFAPVSVLLALAGTFVLIFSSRNKLRAVVSLIGSIALSCLPCWWYLRAYLHTGNPAYPLPLRIPGIVTLPGNAELVELMYGANPKAPPAGSWEHYLTFMHEFFFRFVGYEHLNLTPLAPVVIFLSLCGLAWARQSNRTRIDRVITALLFLLAAVIFIPLLAPGMSNYRYEWPESMGRFFLPGYSLLILLAVQGRGQRIIRILLGVCTAVTLVQAFPLGMSFVDSYALGLGLAASIPVLLVARLVAARRLSRWSLALPVALAVACLGLIRDKYRYAYYHEVPKNYDMHRLVWTMVPSYMWEYLDQPKRPLRIATTAGFYLRGHNWLRAPLMGRNLQNHIQYVPVTTDGSIFDYYFLEKGGRKPASLGDFDAWYGRLRELEIDYVTCAGPFSFELEWMAHRPDLFVYEYMDPRKIAAAFRVIK